MLLRKHTIRSEADLAFVLAQFKSMGATADELKREEARLRSEEMYYKMWCKDIHLWCPEYDCEASQKNNP